MSHPYGQLEKAKRTAAKIAATRGLEIAIVDDHKTEPEYVPVRKIESFMASEKHRGARVLCEVAP